MAIENGTYIVRFSTPMGEGGGVMTLTDGKLRGGDGSMIYVGSYNEPTSGTLSANVRASTHTNYPGVSSVFGIPTVDLTISGSVTGGSGTLKGSAAQAPGVAFEAYIERYCD